MPWFVRNLDDRIWMGRGNRPDGLDVLFEIDVDIRRIRKRNDLDAHVAGGGGLQQTGKGREALGWFQVEEMTGHHEDANYGHTPAARPVEERVGVPLATVGDEFHQPEGGHPTPFEWLPGGIDEPIARHANIRSALERPGQGLNEEHGGDGVDRRSPRKTMD